ncbi:MAG: ATP synthase F1 subunit gamma [Melioribacteraceae bacterium]|nr:MAG: ATP synthase F1 subunit gamma [Melioribacteraceae bacterium]
MATLRDIKRRIVGVKNTQQITKAMKMVAAARLRRAQENIISARPYSRKIAEVLSNLLSIEKNLNNPLFENREVKRTAIIVITSDRGLCGAFNMNVIREAEQTIKNNYYKMNEAGNVLLYCVGKKGVDYFSKRNYKMEGSYPGIFSHLDFSFAAKLIADLKEKFINKEIDEVLVIYNAFKSVVQQELKVTKLLPVQPIEKRTEESSRQTEFLYEPDKATIINSLVPRHLNAQMWTALLDSYASELGARMTAMDMATENAKELIRTLQITYNKERQASITTEILEIVSGANALKNA